ncbi:SNF1-related protein kinase regulatory subunit gamma-1-like [Oryza brachyantha]|uniref:CBS domain-containing protein n=1 Tax=Oryza brachyantha TaxID=4533 RepID=J3L260_ORYBR|nr:SNF1-related protein kinase regulatory subunit gamma-1-like [Oryza brachyantha]
MATRAAGQTGGGEAAGEYWSEALKSFLDHIPVSSVSGALQPSPSPALEIKLDGSVPDAIDSMYHSNVAGAVIVDDVRTSFGKFVDRDIGFLEFPSLLLWALEELDNMENGPGDKNSDLLSCLKQHPRIAETKIAWLSKLFLWEPFFPVRSHDTLFHAMLLFSKHRRINVVPVVESMNSSVTRFVTQNAVMELLLTSSGLEWLDKIADKQLSEFRFYASKPISVYSDQTLADALHILSKEKIGIAVIDRKTRCLIGSILCSELYRLLDDNSLFRNRKTLIAEEFMKLKRKVEDNSTENSPAADVQSVLSLRPGQSKTTDRPVTNRKSDTLKQAMEKLTASRSSCSFIVDEHGRVEGVVTARDIISVFSPPCMDSRIDGGTFFSAALEQTGCRVEQGQMIQNS